MRCKSHRGNAQWRKGVPSLHQIEHVHDDCQTMVNIDSEKVYTPGDERALLHDWRGRLNAEELAPPRIADTDSRNG